MAITPPLSMRGLFKVKSPFVVKADVLYTVDATRTFDDPQLADIDVMALVYTPVGLDKTAHDADVEAGASIVTLTSLSDPPIYIPSTYITQLPDDTAIRYSHIVLSVSLGALPANVVDQLQQTKDVISAAVSDMIGVTPKVNVAVAPSTGSVSYEQYRASEAARKSAIRNRDTEHADNLRLSAENAKLREVIKYYEDLLTGKIPPKKA